MVAGQLELMSVDARMTRLKIKLSVGKVDDHGGVLLIRCRRTSTSPLVLNRDFPLEWSRSAQRTQCHLHILVKD